MFPFPFGFTAGLSERGGGLIQPALRFLLGVDNVRGATESRMEEQEEWKRPKSSRLEEDDAAVAMVDATVLLRKLSENWAAVREFIWRE